MLLSQAKTGAKNHLANITLALTRAAACTNAHDEKIIAETQIDVRNY